MSFPFHLFYKCQWNDTLKNDTLKLFYSFQYKYFEFFFYESVGRKYESGGRICLDYMFRDYGDIYIIIDYVFLIFNYKIFIIINDGVFA